MSQITRSGTVWSALTLAYNTGTRDLKSLDETTRRNGTTFTQEALREYTRSTAGVVTKATTTGASHAADVQCYTYGPLQAMTAAWSSATIDCVGGPSGALGGPAPYSATYTVDPDTGNRTSSTVKTGANGTPTTSMYSYPAAGAARPHAATEVKATTGATTVTNLYQYDESGSMTKRAGQTLTYDGSGRVSSIADGTTTENSIYTADGQLLLRWGASDGASLFLGDTVLRTVGTTTTGIRSYRAAGIAVAERTSGSAGGLWWLSPDPVGTVGLQINAATGAVTRRWMDPYGVSRGGSTTWSSNFGYLNQPKSATGLTQLGARAYDSALGRFITVDPLLDTSDPRHSNAYAYAFNSPVSYSDASGLRPIIEKPDGGWYTPPKRKLSVNNSGTPVSTNPATPKRHGGGPQVDSGIPPAAGNSGWQHTPILGVELKPYTPKNPGDPGWRDEIDELDRNCGSRENATGPCEIDRVLDPAWKALDLAITVMPAGSLIKGLKAASIIEGASGGGGRRPGANGSDELPAGVRPGWKERPADNGKGTVWQDPNSSGNANTLRIMDPNARYSNGYVRFYNEHGQPVGLNGKPGPRPDTHIPRSPDGTYPIPDGW